jgi:hypothetical protein
MTRPTATVLIVAAGWCAVAAWRRGEGRRPLWAPILTATGTAAVMIYQWVLSGHPFEWLRVETQAWHDRSGFTFDAVHRFIDYVKAPTFSFGLGGLNDLVWTAGFVLAVIGAVLMVRRRLPAPLLIYGFGALVFAASSFDVGPRPRPLLVAFPIIIAIAASVRGWAWRVVLVASAVGLVALSLVSFLTLSAVP